MSLSPKRCFQEKAQLRHSSFTYPRWSSVPGSSVPWATSGRAKLPRCDQVHHHFKQNVDTFGQKNGCILAPKPPFRVFLGPLLPDRVFQAPIFSSSSPRGLQSRPQFRPTGRRCSQQHLTARTHCQQRKKNTWAGAGGLESSFLGRSSAMGGNRIALIRNQRRRPSPGGKIPRSGFEPATFRLTV